MPTRLLPGASTIIACLMALSGCATETRDVQESGAAPGVVSAQTDAENHLRRGQLLAIELYGNASTGYAWEILEAGSPILEPAPVPASTDPAPPPMPGAGGTSRWRFRAVQSGATTLRLVYRRSWEKEVEPAETATYRVVVD